MPLDAAIRRVFALYRPGGRHVHRFLNKHIKSKASVQNAQNGPSTQLINATRCIESAEILGDPYSKKSPLLSINAIGTSPCLAISPKDPSYRLLGQSRIHHRHISRNNPTRILAQQKHIILENVY